MGGKNFERKWKKKKVGVKFYKENAIEKKSPKKKKKKWMWHAEKLSFWEACTKKLTVLRLIKPNIWGT